MSMAYENEGLKGTFLKAAHLNGRLKIFSQLFQNMSSHPDFVFLFVENRQKKILASYPELQIGFNLRPSAAGAS